MPKDEKKSGASEKNNGASQDEIICVKCGTKMNQWQCKYICSNCGYITTCSEEDVW
ncbi:hypothetical protein HZA39_01250 [Candidatus Peregrinibacteria bacterium]|nr:hypothetical protein [Candidatus Peregrinibacteria bacterium]